MTKEKQNENATTSGAWGVVEQEAYNRQVGQSEGWYGGPYQKTNKKFRKTYCDATGSIDYNKLPTEAPASPERYPMVYRAFQLKTMIDAKAKEVQKNRMRTSIDTEPKQGLLDRMKSSIANMNKQKESA